MDWSRTGWLRSVLRSSNGLEKLGSTWIARRPRQAATITAKTTPKKIRTRATMLLGGGSATVSSGTDGYSLVGSSTSGDCAIPTTVRVGYDTRDSRSGEGVQTGQFLADDQLMDLRGSLVREHAFEVGGVPHDRVFAADPVT